MNIGQSPNLHVIAKFSDSPLDHRWRFPMRGRPEAVADKTPLILWLQVQEICLFKISWEFLENLESFA